MAGKLGKIIFLSFLFILVLFILGGVLFFMWWQRVTAPVDPNDNEKIMFVIPKGNGASQIAADLKEQGLIKSELAFKLMVKKEGIGSKIQAGDFYLTRAMNLFELSQSLTHGTVDIWVTIPEGLRREEIAAIFTKKFSEQNLEFDEADFLSETQKLEGYLFPDTYLIPKLATSEQIVQILRDTFDKKVTAVTQQAESSNLSFSDSIILASLLEREAKNLKDRQLVAGILLNRLRVGMALQVDASVQYALGTEEEWWPKEINTKYKSAYNTYLHPGLPPTPICNPSLTSIQAVLEPTPSEYWYYLSDPSGTMHYSKTIEEHNQNIEEFLR